jgi:hypothetical protein
MKGKGAIAESGKRPGAVARSKKHRPTNQEIAERAYYIFLRHGSSHGFDLDDWLQAERELVGRN